MLSQCHLDLQVRGHIPAVVLYASSKIRSRVSAPQGLKFALSDYFGYLLSQQHILPYRLQ